MKSAPFPSTTKPHIKTLSFSHEAIIRWMLANPGGKLKDCAEHFGYRQAWLSVIVHSDVFQARYCELSENADSLVINDIPAKMRGAASLALDGLAAQVELAVNDGSAGHRGFLKESADMLLTRLGYGQKGGAAVSVNVPPGAEVGVTVSAPSLQRARERLLQSRADSATVVEGELVPATPT